MNGHYLKRSLRKALVENIENQFATRRRSSPSTRSCPTLRVPAMSCRTRRLSCVVASILGFLSAAESLRADDFNTQVTLATFKLVNPKTTATAFLLTRPAADKPGEIEWILVTAAHAMEEAPGDFATLILRKKRGDEYEKLPFTLRLRRDGKPLWKKHPEADVAVMRISPPPTDAEPPHLSLDLLADDAAYKKYEIHPGDFVHSCGYPHKNEANQYGFPLTRMGSIAGFPLTPSKTIHSYFVDLNVFEGDSGGPLYMSEANRFYNGKVQPASVQLILGVVVAQQQLNEELRAEYTTLQVRHRMGFAVIVPAQFVREAVASLPSPTPTPAPPAAGK
jgi:hypothetical protein